MMASAVRDGSKRLPAARAFGSHTSDDVSLRRYQDTRRLKSDEDTSLSLERSLVLRVISRSATRYRYEALGI